MVRENQSKTGKTQGQRKKFNFEMETTKKP